MDVSQMRSATANLALLGFVIFTSLGAFQYETWVGFVILGLTSGIAALFLGADAE